MIDRDLERKRRIDKIKNFKLIKITQDEYKKIMILKTIQNKEIKLNRGIFRCIEYLGGKIEKKRKRLKKEN